MFLPTLEQCQNIVANNQSFKCKEETINGVKVLQFNYFLAKFNDFAKPLTDEDITAYELRGITFVEQQDGSFKRHLLLPKFFNLNQCEDTLYHNVKDNTVVCVADKLDGSMISFIPVNGKVMAKTKFSFFSEQAVMAQKLYENDPILKEFVNTSLDFEYSPIFELVSPQNRIVLPYNKTELRLIQLRKNDGTFKDIYATDFLNKWNIPVSSKESYTLDEITSLAEEVEDKEGWVVTFENGHMLKVKTKWYFEKHRLVTGDISVEHKIIEMTLNETIDDVLSQIPEDAVELRNFVNTISDAVIDYADKYVNKMWEKYNTTVSHLAQLTVDEPAWVKKDFVNYTRLNNPDIFTDMMFMYDKMTMTVGDINEIVEKYVVDKIIKQTNALNKARKFLQEIGVNVHLNKVEED